MHGPARRRRFGGLRLPALPRLPRAPRVVGRSPLPIALAAIAVIAAASTSASASRVTIVDGPPAVRAGTALPPAVPPTYSLPGSTVPGTVPGGPAATDRASAPGGAPSAAAAQGLTSSGIPAVAREAYEAASTASACGVPWSLLAAIGRVESNHGRFAGSTLLADGRSDPPIVGIPLDGRPGVARITDTDLGRHDGDLVYDRAVGPMQFIPGTWAMFEADGDGDGKSDPFDLDDAAAAAAEYLCRAGGDLRTDGGQQDAVFSYNRSDSYVLLVLDLAAEYQRGAPVDSLPAPDRTPRPLPPPATPTLPPVAIGDPPAASPTTPAPTARPTATPTTPRPTTSAPTRPAPTTPAPTTRPTTGPTPGPTTPAPTTGPTTPAPTTPAPTTPAPTCTPAPTPTGSGSPTPTGSASPTPSPTPTPTPTTPSPTPTVTPTGTPTPSPTPTLPTCPTP